MKKKLIGAAIFGLVLAHGALAQTSPAGLWKTIDDDGKTAKSLVRITEAGGVLSGTVEKVFDPAKQDAKCDKCSDDRKDKPVLGMTIHQGRQAGGRRQVPLERRRNPRPDQWQDLQDQDLV